MRAFIVACVAAVVVAAIGAVVLSSIQVPVSVAFTTGNTRI